MDRHLTDDERERITGFYNERFERTGRSHATVAWGSTEDQLLRFSVLLRGFDPRGKRILDVGCGLGDLVPYLDSTYGDDYDFLGVDISEKLLEDARAKYGSERRCFEVCDILESDVPSADLVLLSGALSLRIGDNITHAKTMIRRMWKLSTEGIAVNFLSSYVDYEEPKNFHYSPEVMFTFSKSLSRWVALHHDYPLWEFTVQISRQPRPKTAG